MQPLSFHGLEIAVPATWKLNDTRCGTPQSDTALIMDGSAVETCYVEERPGLTVARMDLLSTPDGHALDRLATEWITLDGHRAKRGTGHALGYPTPFQVLSVPDVGVVASVRSTDAELSQAILSAATVAPVDSAGCADHVDTLWPDRDVSRPDGGGRFVTGTPAAAVVCRYADLWLNRSVIVSDTERDRLVTTLNELPAGGSAQVPVVCADDAGRGFIVRFRYDDATLSDVFVHVSPCDLRVGNGRRVGSANAQLIDAVTSIAGYDGSLPDPSRLK